MTEILVGIIVVLFALLLWQRWALVRTQRGFRALKSLYDSRPIGEVTKVKWTDDGLECEGTIWSPEARAKLAQDLTGLSIYDRTGES